MQMSDFEIVRDFKNAAKKGKQIGTLADMNGCSREKIREVLLRNGISEAELPGKPGRRPSEEEKEIFRPAKTAKQKPGGGLPRVAGGTESPAPEPKESIRTAEPKTDIPAAVPQSEVLLVEEMKQPVPEAVMQLCRNRIWSILREIGELEKEKRELQVFLGENTV